MNKEELLEMVNNTICENGAGMITGKALNLALTTIINTLGEGGGGGLMVQWLPRFALGQYVKNGVVTPGDMPSETASVLQEYIDQNIKVYNTLMECSRNHTPVPGPIYFDTTFFEWFYNGREASVRGGTATSWRVWGNENNYVGIWTMSNQNYEDDGHVTEEPLYSDGLIGHNDN